jgi:hypothetical protein
VYLGYFVAAVLGSMVDRKVNADIAVALSNALYAATILFLYRLFRPVNGVLALTATGFGLLGCTAEVLDQINWGPAGFSPLVFFGPFCMLLGLLILRSEFTPHGLGWPLLLAGAAWLASLVPAVALRAKIVIFPLGFLAELALMFWLLIKGVDEARWVAAEARRRKVS